MSEFKFACPVCGQHITADSGNTGARIECPTCFRKIIVPQAPAVEDPKFILAASQPQQRPIPQPPPANPPVPTQRSPTLKLSVVLAALVVACAAGVPIIAFREKIFKAAGQTGKTNAPATATNVAVSTPPVVTDTNWTLDLTNAAIPDTPVAGRIHGKAFICERAVLQGGTLHLRQGSNGPPDLGVSIHLFATQGEDLAGKSISIAANLEPPRPHIILRWKDDHEQPATRNFQSNYVLHLDFDQVSSNRIPGKIYLCLPDEMKSYVAGNFEAENRKLPPRPPRQGRPKRIE